MDKLKTIGSLTSTFLSYQSSNDLLNQKHDFNNQESIFADELSLELSANCFAGFKKLFGKKKSHNIFKNNDHK